MTTELWVAIAIALIGFAGPIVLYVIQGFGNRKKIKQIASDTAEITPKINNIDYRTEKQLAKLDVLVADVDYRKRLEASFPSGLSGRDMIHAGAQKLLNEGAELNLQHQELSLKYQQAQNRIMELNAENSQLRSQVAQLRSRLQVLDQDYEWEP